MNRAEYMRQLESLLKSIAPAERESALKYYNDYFDDAGPENEQEVMKALGTPAKVAQSIKEELLGRGYGESNEWKASADDRAMIKYGSYDGRNTDAGYGSKDNHADTSQENSGSAACYDTSDEQQAQTQLKRKESGKLSGGVIALIVILCLLASPMLFGAVTGLGGLLFGLVAAWLSLIVGFGAAAIVLFIVMIILLVLGIAAIIVSPIGALGILGAALICGGLGLIFLILTVGMAGVATPAIIKGIAALFRRFFGKKEK